MRLLCTVIKDFLPGNQASRSRGSAFYLGKTGITRSFVRGNVTLCRELSDLEPGDDKDRPVEQRNHPWSGVP